MRVLLFPEVLRRRVSVLEQSGQLGFARAPGVGDLLLFGPEVGLLGPERLQPGSQADFGVAEVVHPLLQAREIGLQLGQLDGVLGLPGPCLFPFDLNRVQVFSSALAFRPEVIHLTVESSPLLGRGPGTVLGPGLCGQHAVELTGQLFTMPVRAAPLVRPRLYLGTHLPFTVLGLAECRSCALELGLQRIESGLGGLPSGGGSLGLCAYRPGLRPPVP